MHEGCFLENLLNTLDSSLKLTEYLIFIDGFNFTVDSVKRC